MNGALALILWKTAYQFIRNLRIIYP